MTERDQDLMDMQRDIECILEEIQSRKRELRKLFEEMGPYLEDEE